MEFRDGALRGLCLFKLGFEQGLHYFAVINPKWVSPNKNYSYYCKNNSPNFSFQQNMANISCDTCSKSFIKKSKNKPSATNLLLKFSLTIKPCCLWPLVKNNYSKLTTTLVALKCCECHAMCSVDLTTD